jgi:hypothetical protein
MRSLAHPKGGGRVRFPVDFECWLALVRGGITRDEPLLDHTKILGSTSSRPAGYGGYQ